MFRLNHLDSSYLILLFVVGVGFSVAILFYTGLLGWVFGWLGHIVKRSIQQGFLLWERWFAWASWPVFLAVILGLLVVGWAANGSAGADGLVRPGHPAHGATACLAYMFIDLERYEVERGHKALHNPLKGQGLALHLARYGQQVRVPLLAAATVAMVGGFALLNQGLYDRSAGIGMTFGETRGPGYVDFLAYALINLLRIVDVLNIARSPAPRSRSRASVRPPGRLPPCSPAFQTFFTFVLLQQIFASIRQGWLLAETITDFWSPHESIHERARNALPQYGALAIGPLLLSLRSVACLTKEQRDQLPPILAADRASRHPRPDPSSARPPRAHACARGRRARPSVHAGRTCPCWSQLAHDPSDVVRQSLVEAMGLIGARGPAQTAPGSCAARIVRWRARGPGGWFGEKESPHRPRPPTRSTWPW